MGEGGGGEEKGSFFPSPLFLFRFHFSPFPQKRLILRLNATRSNVQYLHRPISVTGIFRTFDSITCSLMLFSLRRTRFRASSSRKSLGREQKRGMKGEAGGRGRRKRLQANSTILKNCVCSRTQLLIVAKDCCGTVSDQYINQTR